MQRLLPGVGGWMGDIDGVCGCIATAVNVR